VAQTQQDLRQAINSFARKAGPVLSAYISTNPAIPENQERAYLVRLRAGMNEQGVPEDVQRKVREHVEDETHPGARSVAIFADEEGLLDVYRIQFDMPETIRWGEPYVVPLLLVLDEQEPYGAAVIDAERFRYFVVSPLQPSEGAARKVKGNGYLELDFSPSRPYPRGGGSRQADPAGRKQQENIKRFYKDIGELTRDLTFKEGVKRLILAGPEERLVEFREQLPNEIRDRVAAEEGVPLDASEGTLLERLENARRRAEHEREGKMLEEIRESGVWGLNDTITALQEENRVYYLAVLWDLEGEILWSDEEGLAILDITRDESPYSGSPTRARPLMDVLVDLAAARGARIDFVTGDNEHADTLRDEFGGIAGLTRF
jgi:peptide subunit release factor 1 (eRF1)